MNMSENDQCDKSKDNSFPISAETGCNVKSIPNGRFILVHCSIKDTQFLDYGLLLAMFKIRKFPIIGISPNYLSGK